MCFKTSKFNSFLRILISKYKVEVTLWQFQRIVKHFCTDKPEVTIDHTALFYINTSQNNLNFIVPATVCLKPTILRRIKFYA